MEQKARDLQKNIVSVGKLSDSEFRIKFPQETRSRDEVLNIYGDHLTQIRHLERHVKKTAESSIEANNLRLQEKYNAIKPLDPPFELVKGEDGRNYLRLRED